MNTWESTELNITGGHGLGMFSKDLTLQHRM